MTKRLTKKQIDAALEAAGFAERVFIDRAKAYCYFGDGEAHTWRSSSVLVPRLSDLTIEQWIAERNMLANDRSY